VTIDLLYFLSQPQSAQCSHVPDETFG